MGWIKKNAVLFFLTALVYCAYIIFHHPGIQQSKPSHVLGASNNLTFFEEPQNGHSPIVDAIDNAEQEIDMEVYLLSDKQVINALISAEQKGVTVKVMLEEHPFGGGNLNPKTKTTLEKAGISVEWTSSSFALTHEKSIVIDDSEAFILNQNLTASAFNKNREYDIIDDNPQDVAEIETIFTSDWKREATNLANSTDLIISPDNSRSALTSLLQSATKSIDIEMEEIQDKDILSLLETKAKTEEIEVIIPDFSQLSANKSSAELLEKSGVLVKTLSSPYIHAKLVLVDGIKAYVGSVNFSSQSMDKNRELGILILQSDVVDSLVSDFESDWNIASN